MIKKSITFLLDKQNNWIEQFVKNSIFFTEKQEEYDFKISHDPCTITNQDIVFILSYTKILNSNFLEANQLNLVLHESKLPEGKGFAPVQWQILDGCNRIPISLIIASSAFDSGDVVFRSEFILDGTELYDEIRRKQAIGTLDTIVKFLNIYPNFFKEKQSGGESFYPKRYPNDSKLNINDTLKEQFNLLRVCNNEEWPAFFYYKETKYIVKIYPEETS